MIVGDWIEVECGWRRIEQVFRGRAYVRVIPDGSKTGYLPSEVLSHRDARFIREGDEVFYKGQVYTVRKITKSPEGSIAHLSDAIKTRLSNVKLHKPFEAITQPMTVDELLDEIVAIHGEDDLQIKLAIVADLQLRLLEP